MRTARPSWWAAGSRSPGARVAGLRLEDGVHRALRAALQQRNVIHVRVLDLDALTPVQAPAGPPTATIPAQLPVPNPRRV